MSSIDKQDRSFSIPLPWCKISVSFHVLALANNLGSLNYEPFSEDWFDNPDCERPQNATENLNGKGTFDCCTESFQVTSRRRKERSKEFDS
jgi:hypothetical protein